VWLPNRVEAVAVLLASSRQGYVCNPSLHQNYTVAEIALLLARTRAAALFAQPGYGADARTADIFSAVTDLPSLRRVYYDRGRPRDRGAVPPRRRRATLAAGRYQPDKIVYLAFTSGTTGTPKGVMHSDNTLLANARAMVEDWHHDERTILLSLSPLSHHIAAVALAQSLAAGMELAVNAPPAGRTPLDWIIETGATYVMGVPTHAMDILGEMRRRGVEKLGAVKTFYMAGSPIPARCPDISRPRIMPQNVYGMSEKARTSITRPDDPAETIVATCGRACRAYEIRLWDRRTPISKWEGRDRRDRRARRLSDAGVLRQPGSDRRIVQPRGLVHVGRSRPVDDQGCLEIVGRRRI